jgi:predicted Zn-dependent peptidase
MISDSRSVRALGLLLVVAMLSMPCAAYAGKGDAAAIELDVTVEYLDNGLKVILLEDHSVPVISYQTFFRVGARNERPGITGISHFMEHMMFNGTEKYGPQEFDRILEANGGYSNAFTSKNMTAYYEDFASDVLELIVDLDSDRLKSLALDPQYVVSEMGVVKEERRLSIDNSVAGMMYEELYALAYKAHPYSWPVLGWMSDLEKIDRDDCVEYFRTFYAPNNAILIVAGDFDTKEAMKLIHQYYDDIPSQEVSSDVRTVEPEQFGERRADVHKPAELPQIMIGYHGPAASSGDIFALDVLESVLTGGNSSRLYRKLVRDLGIAISVESSFGWAIDPGLLFFDVKMKPGVDAAKGEEAIYSEFEAIATEGVSEEELSRAKNMLEADFIRSMQTVNRKARKIGTYEIYFGDFSGIPEVPAKYRAVTNEDIKRVAGEYFSRRNRNVVTLVPEKSDG